MLLKPWLGLSAWLLSSCVDRRGVHGVHGEGGGEHVRGNHGGGDHVWTGGEKLEVLELTSEEMLGSHCPIT